MIVVMIDDDAVGSAATMHDAQRRRRGGATTDDPSCCCLRAAQAAMITVPQQGNTRDRTRICRGEGGQELLLWRRAVPQHPRLLGNRQSSSIAAVACADAAEGTAAAFSAQLLTDVRVAIVVRQLRHRADVSL